MSEVRILGPKREWVPEFEDPDTGEIYPGHFIQVIIAEALGTDGNLHGQLTRWGDTAFDQPEILDVAKTAVSRALEMEMKDKEVWSGE